VYHYSSPFFCTEKTKNREECVALYCFVLFCMNEWMNEWMNESVFRFSFKPLKKHLIDHPKNHLDQNEWEIFWNVIITSLWSNKQLWKENCEFQQHLTGSQGHLHVCMIFSPFFNCLRVMICVDILQLIEKLGDWE
jgi:hypothetical protein